jgi:phosphate/sulfate permease
MVVKNSKPVDILDSFLFSPFSLFLPTSFFFFLSSSRKKKKKKKKDEKNTGSERKRKKKKRKPNHINQTDNVKYTTLFF